MREFSFRFITGAILAFVFLYIFSLKGGEALITREVSVDVRQAILVDPEELLSGEASYTELVNARTKLALDQGWIRRLVGLGLELRVTVQTTGGVTIYPRLREWFPPNGLADPLADPRAAPSALPPAALHPRPRAEVARENYEILREGLTVDTWVSIRNNTWLANGILVIYLFLLLQILWVHARRFVLRTEQEKLEIAERLDRESAERVARIETELKRVTTKLDEASRHASERVTQIRALESEKARLEQRLGGWTWEDAGELEKELERLEQKLEDARADKKIHEAKIEELSASIQRREGKPVPKGRARDAELLDRRLRTLYKNLEFESRVVSDIINLGDDDAMLRAEEVLKRLNDRDDNLPMRRKVGGLEHGNIFELGFAGKGRIYCCQAEGGRYRVILVGAKNTQDRDLSYLRRYR
ncbi:MAG: hypothetical protein Q8R92_14010 [Deltaproteobacteria bacterium]|nr:hypothetical protein [Deltaproteobacteria bacterium]